MFRTISAKIVIPALAILLISVIGAGFLSFNKTRTVLKERVTSRYLETSINKVTAQVNTIIGSAVETSRFLTRDPAVVRWVESGEEDEQLGNNIKDRLALLKEELGYYTTFLVPDTTRNYWADGHTHLETITQDDPDDSWYFDSMNMDSEYALNLDYNKELDDTYLFVNTQIRSDGEPIGIAGVGLQIDSLTESFRSLNITESSMVHLIDRKGSVLISSRKEAIGEQLSDIVPSTAASRVLEAAGNEKRELSVSSFSIESEAGNREVAWQEVPESDYTVIASVPSYELTGFIQPILRFATIAMLIAVAVASALLYLATVSITKPIKQVSRRLEEISEGEADLTQSIEVHTRDEVGTLSTSFNKFVSELRNIIDSIKQSFSKIEQENDEIATSSNETASAIYEIKQNVTSTQSEFENFQQRLSKSSSSFDEVTSNIQNLHNQIENQASAIEETTASVEEMNASIKNVSQTAEKRREDAEELTDVVSTTKANMQRVNKDVQDLNQRAEEMVKATDVINSISSQTNLLSMNAAIEAAHAGDAGRGFAVVAEEIRSLAESSAQNAKDISDGLKGSVEIIRNLGEISSKAEGDFDRIEKVSQNTIESLKEITSTMNELTTGTEEINRAISSLRDISSKVGESSTSIEKEVNGVQQEIQTVNNMSEQITGALSEIISGSEQINTAMNELNDSIQDLRESVGEISSTIGSFKT